jgi:uncharacterized protein
MKRKYQYNFESFMGTCAMNYMLINKLVPDLNRNRVEYLVADDYRICFHIKERCRYTTMLKVKIASSDYPDWLTQTTIEVRLYHDANLAEVMNNDGSAMLPVHDYPNQQMQHIDEKTGLNDFLGEWLAFCLKQGRCSADIKLESVLNNNFRSS